MPRKFAVGHVAPQESSRITRCRILRSGYTSAQAADDAVADIASEFGVAWQECAVVELSEHDDAADSCSSRN